MSLRKYAPTLAFAGFAVLIACRDVWWELSLSKTEDFTCFALLICLTIASLSLFNIIFLGDGFRALLGKLSKLKVLVFSMIVGILAGVLYATGLYLVTKIGAGLCNLVDYGLTPLATLAIGMLFYKERFRVEMPIAFAVYLTGLILLTHHLDMQGFAYVGVALLIPFIVASSDGMTKWLISEDGGNLTKAELLFVRFTPGALVLAVYVSFLGNGFKVQAISESLLAAFLCGFVPLWLLCTGLGKAGMKELASWEFIIPAIAFFATLPARWVVNGNLPMILGASLALAAWMIMETKLLHTFYAWTKRTTAEVAPAASNA